MSIEKTMSALLALCYQHTTNEARYSVEVANSSNAAGAPLVHVRIRKFTAHDRGEYVTGTCAEKLTTAARLLLDEVSAKWPD